MIIGSLLLDTRYVVSIGMRWYLFILTGQYLSKKLKVEEVSATINNSGDTRAILSCTHVNHPKRIATTVTANNNKSNQLLEPQEQQQSSPSDVSNDDDNSENMSNEDNNNNDDTSIDEKGLNWQDVLIKLKILIIIA